MWDSAPQGRSKKGQRRDREVSKSRADTSYLWEAQEGFPKIPGTVSPGIDKNKLFTNICKDKHTCKPAEGMGLEM